MGRQRVVSWHDDIETEGRKPMKLHISNIGQDATESGEMGKFLYREERMTRQAIQKVRLRK